MPGQPDKPSQKNETLSTDEQNRQEIDRALKDPEGAGVRFNPLLQAMPTIEQDASLLQENRKETSALLSSSAADANDEEEEGTIHHKETAGVFRLDQIEGRPMGASGGTVIAPRPKSRPRW